MSKNYVDISDPPTLWKTKDLPKSRIELPIIIRSKRSLSVYIRFFSYLIVLIALLKALSVFIADDNKIYESNILLLFAYLIRSISIFLILWILFYVFLSILFIFKQTISTDPLIIIDEKGILDTRIRAEPFTWESIEKIGTLRPDISFESTPAGLYLYIKDGNFYKTPISANWTISLIGYVYILLFSRRHRCIPVSLVSTTQSRHVVMSVIEHFLDPYGLRR